MFQNQELLNHIETSATIKTRSLVVAEWNLNNADNIYQIGNYRYRPLAGLDSKYGTITNSFDPNDEGNFYTNATYADIIIDGGLEDDNSTPLTFVSPQEKERLLYSLESCFDKFRPRSGINKLRYFDGKYSHHTNIDMASRPRYYMAHKEDSFKYWTSYRKEESGELGISFLKNDQYYIDDANPYVVYKDAIPTNRIVTKIQTNVGSTDLGPFSDSEGSYDDPFFGEANKTTPVDWKIQYLKNEIWIDLINFDSTSTRADGSPIFDTDGYLQIDYGLVVPEQYRNIFIFVEELSSAALLPEQPLKGYSYLVKTSDSDIGIFYIWTGSEYEQFNPVYDWRVGEEGLSPTTNFVTSLVVGNSFIDPTNNTTKYREFEYIEGLRIVTRTMNRQDATLDLIELSPRLTVDISDKVTQFNLTKSASDLGVSGMPVGQLLASTGSLSIFDYDQSFTPENSNSIIKEFSNKNLQIKLYEAIADVNGYDYFVPIKTMYASSFEETNAQTREVAIDLRDLFIYFESITAPQILIQNASVSYAISMLLDAIGFSNYVFKRVPGEDEEIIPYFFVPPDTTVAQVLNDLAVSTQTAMFFDEFNNFVMMSKEYIMPSAEDRKTDVTLYGTKDFEDDGVIENKKTQEKLSNIMDISFQNTDVYNAGSINYTTRYIQRSVGTIKQASLIDRERVWTYKPALLWEVSPTELTKSINGERGDQSSYVLSAIPLNSDLTDVVPRVANGRVTNNVIDLGEGVYWLPRYSGYFYANGEVIKFDAVEFSVPAAQSISGQATGTNNVWISSNQEYQKYFSKIPFNGKMYPTGKVRIYSEPNYEVVDGVTSLSNGAVAKHGRGQFNTTVVYHHAGLSPYWSDNANVRGCTMNSDYLFNFDTNLDANELNLDSQAAGVSNTLATKTTRNGIVKNFLTNSFKTEAETNRLYSTETGTIQSSALIMNGPSFSTIESPIDFISYVHKPLENKFKHFGTRMRIIGKIENSEARGQTGIGSSTYFVSTTADPSLSVNIGGSSGGLGVMLNPETNAGYYFEIAALTATNLESYENSENINNVFFYKIMRDSDSGEAIPVKLYDGIANIIVDDGKFTGQYRMNAESNPTVYDLAVEYQDVGSTRRFFLYINNRIVATVDDTNPLPIYSNMGLFVRGASRCMFENIYAITNNYSQNTSYALDTPVSKVFDEDKEIDANDSFRKYAMSGVIQASYLSGISPSESPKYNIYFEEFGTIMREASYFDIRYDKAYPALYAKLSPTFNKIKGYTVSGFLAGAYGAEFLIFNATDTALSLDETTGNYLRIQGVTFTQQSQNELTVDEYFEKVGDLSDPQFEQGDSLIISPIKIRQQYQDIKLSRMTNGRKEFSLDAKYIQSDDDANNLMRWLISKTMKPRKSVGIRLFANPMIQLGDIVEVEYSKDQINQISETGARFVVYNISYSKSSEGPEMEIFLSEVI